MYDRVSDADMATERDNLRERLDLAVRRLDAVERTLVNVGASRTDVEGHKLNANGMLVDWLAGRRDPDWIGTEGKEIDRLRAERDDLELGLGAAQDALKDIVLHADMAAGEAWETAYREVTQMALDALRGPRGGGSQS